MSEELYDLVKVLVKVNMVATAIRDLALYFSLLLSSHNRHLKRY
jgi:hypothetical protein